MSKQKLIFAFASLLPVVAFGTFLMLSPALTASVSAGACAPGICQKNGCTEGSQECLADGSGWLACGTC